MTNLFAQENESIEEIVIDSSLFKQPNRGSYDFSVSNGSFLRGVQPEEIKDINEVISINKGYLKVRISYGCGCGQTIIKLVTDGVERKDKTGKIYYRIKLFFTSNDMCRASCHEKLTYDLSKLKKSSESKLYVKFQGFKQLIAFEDK